MLNIRKLSLVGPPQSDDKENKPSLRPDEIKHQVRRPSSNNNSNLQIYFRRYKPAREDNKFSENLLEIAVHHPAIILRQVARKVAWSVGVCVGEEL